MLGGRGKMRKQVGEIYGVRMVADDEERVWWLTWRGGEEETEEED